MEISDIHHAIMDRMSIGKGGFITGEKILKEVCREFGYELEAVIGQSRVREYVDCRMVGIALTMELTQLSTLKIGRLYGGRDHSTVIHNTESFRNALRNHDKRSLDAVKIYNVVKNKLVKK